MKPTAGRTDTTTWILAGLVGVAALIALRRERSLPLEGLKAGGRMALQVLPQLVLGFALAGLLQVLLPLAKTKQWLGEEAGSGAVLSGWLLGLVIPGGPWMFYPVAAGLQRSGASFGAIIALLTAKTLVSPVRALSYELPILGWRLTVVRLLPAFFLPPLLGWLGQRMASFVWR